MKKIVFFAFLLLGIHYSQSQLVDEYEINVGYSIFQGDYGVRGDFTSTMGNSGFLVGGKAYFNLLDYYRGGCYPCQHVKFPLSFTIGYSLLNFDHADINTSSPEALKVKAFRGKIFQSSLSFGFEYHIGDLKKYAFDVDNFWQNFDPYVGLSAGAAVYAVSLKSDLGDFKLNPNVLPQAFQGHVYDKPNIVPVITMEAGLRYNLSSNMNLTINGKWLYYISDRVDGLSPDPSLVDNVHDDWQFAPSIGIVIMPGGGGFFAQR